MSDRITVLSSVQAEVAWLTSLGCPSPDVVDIPLGYLSAGVLTVLVFAGKVVQTPEPQILNGVNYAKPVGSLGSYVATPERVKANPALALAEMRELGLAVGDYNAVPQFNPPKPQQEVRQVFVDDVVGALDPNRKGSNGEPMYEPTPGTNPQVPDGHLFRDGQGNYHLFVSEQVTTGMFGIIRWKKVY